MKHLNTFDEFLNEASYPQFVIEFINEMTTAKDIKRINDLISKAGGDGEKEVALATTMAKLIKNKSKALTRYEGAVDVLGHDHHVTHILGRRAIELGHEIDLNAEPVAKDTLGKLGSEIPGTKAAPGGETRGRRGSRFSRYDTSILPIGSTNLATGKSKYFNIYDTWGKGKGSTIELWKVPAQYSGKDKDSYKFIITSGSSGLNKIGATDTFQHDQTQRWLFNAELVDWANIGDADLLMKKYGVKSAPGYVYK